MRQFFTPIVILLVAALVIAVVASQSSRFKQDETPAVVAESEVVTETAAVDATPAPTADEVATQAAINQVPLANTMLGALQETGEHATLLKVAEAVGMTEALSSDYGDVTLFAPTDAAFAQLPPGTLDRLMDPGNKQPLADLMRRHVLNERLTLSDVETRATDGKLTVKSVGGADVVLVRINQGPWGVQTAYGETATITKPDFAKLNGVVQVIDRVLAEADMMPVNHGAEDEAVVTDETVAEEAPDATVTEEVPATTEAPVEAPVEPATQDEATQP